MEADGVSRPILGCMNNVDLIYIYIYIYIYMCIYIYIYIYVCVCVCVCVIFSGKAKWTKIFKIFIVLHASRKHIFLTSILIVKYYKNS